MVTVSMLQFSFVEQPSFKEFMIAYQPEVALPSRYSFVKTLEKKYESSKAAVEFVAIIADCWTAHRRSYLGVTVHWLCCDNFERKRAALAC